MFAVVAAGDVAAGDGLAVDGDLKPLEQGFPTVTELKNIREAQRVQGLVRV